MSIFCHLNKSPIFLPLLKSIKRETNTGFETGGSHRPQPDPMCLSLSPAKPSSKWREYFPHVREGYICPLGICSLLNPQRNPSTRSREQGHCGNFTFQWKQLGSALLQATPLYIS